MHTFADCTALTVLTDTTECNVGTITLSARAKRIIGVWAVASLADTLTSTESQGGIVRLDSPDFAISPFKFPLAVVSCLTSGVACYEPRIIPVSIPCSGQAKVTCYITKDDTDTGAGMAGRVGLIYEGDD